MTAVEEVPCRRCTQPRRVDTECAHCPPLPDPTLGGLLGPRPAQTSTDPAADSGVATSGGSTAGRTNRRPGGEPSLSAEPVEDRVQFARAEIARRLALAVLAEEGWRDDLTTDAGLFIAENCPGYARLVLAAADATLDRHTGDGHEDWHSCNGYTHGFAGWLCPDVAAVLDLYAPEVRGG